MCVCVLSLILGVYLGAPEASDTIHSSASAAHSCCPFAMAIVNRTVFPFHSVGAVDHTASHICLISNS